MNKIRKILEDVKSGSRSVEEALESMKALPYEDIEFAKIDTHRDLRKGFPETIYAPGKRTEEIEEIVKHMISVSEPILITKADKDVYERLKKLVNKIEYNDKAKMIVVGEKRKTQTQKTILVVAAGTSDIPVAEEAAFTCEAMGSKTARVYDVGVAGLHRLLDKRGILASASVIIVVAGMEGALPSIVSGLVSCPVIAVPTSVGYGANLKGISALLTMLNSCSSGMGVVNIDNGFGAGYLASVIIRV
jgi:hypothetical protein